MRKPSITNSTITQNTLKNINDDVKDDKNTQRVYNVLRKVPPLSLFSLSFSFSLLISLSIYLSLTVYHSITLFKCPNFIRWWNKCKMLFQDKVHKVFHAKDAPLERYQASTCLAHVLLIGAILPQTQWQRQTDTHTYTPTHTHTHTHTRTHTHIKAFHKRDTVFKGTKNY